MVEEMEKDFEIKRIDGKPIEYVDIEAFGHKFVNMLPGNAKDLITLEKEGAIYAEFIFDEKEYPQYFRISLLPHEIVRYVEGCIAEQEFDNKFHETKLREEALQAISNPDIRKDVENYKMVIEDKGKLIEIDEWVCQSSFLGPDLEALVCGQRRERYEPVIPIKRENAYAFVIQILHTASTNVRYMLNRRANRPPYLIEHEFDFQDIVYVSLKGSFLDTIIEDYAPNIAGYSPRIDIVIPSENIVIENKLVRDKKHSKSIIKEIFTDIEGYYLHPNCSQLIFHIYDPGNFIVDPFVFQKDISGLRIIKGKEIEVTILIV